MLYRRWLLFIIYRNNNMYDQKFIKNHKCEDCQLYFEAPLELLNHKQKFCINSGYDNLEGLQHLQFKGGNPTKKPQFSNKNYLQQYGTNSLTKVGQYNNLNANNLQQDMKKINNFKRQLEGVKKYTHNDQLYESKMSSSKSTVLQKSYINQLSESRLDQDLKKYQKMPKQDAISPPTFIDQLNMRNHTILDKSNSSIGRMQGKDKIQYAQIKLDQLNEIRDMYIQNGGSKKDFKANVDKMIDFYQNFLKKCREDERKDKNILNESQDLIQSRASTPILKLRNLNDIAQSPKRSKVAQNQSKKIQQHQNNSTLKRDGMNNYNMFNPYAHLPYQPPPYMMPYPIPQYQNSIQSPPSDSYRLLQKMVQLKSEQNKKLLEILLQDKKRSNMPQPIYMPSYMNQPSNLPVNSNIVHKEPNEGRKTNNREIDKTESYQFKKQMIQDLISEQKVLLALQQEQLDQLKLLSQLPKELQEIKMKSVIKASDTRFQIQKELLKQKLERLAYQEQNQTFEQVRKINNDRWAGQQRKKLLQNQMGKYVNNFQQQFNNQ